MYLSNIMWKRNGGDYRVCIVWTLIAFIRVEKKLSKVALEALQTQGFDPIPSTAHKRLDELYLQILHENTDAEELTW